MWWSRRARTVGFKLGVAGVLAVHVTGALGQTSVANEPAGRAAVAHGEITGNDVYVRSGPSLNHYPICKLDAGARVRIVGEASEWFEILPPEGTFSLISGDYVDTADEERGVVNGNSVRVRAGSLLNENKYTVQTMLSKGAEVTILGRNPDGFLRIAPPPGATVWIAREFVEPVPEELVKLEAQAGRAAPTGAATTSPVSAPDRTGAQTRAGDEPVISPTLAGLPDTPQRENLEKLDADTRTELAKPIFERKLEPLIERYRVVASQNKDELARRYAEARIRQLEDAISLIDTVRHMRRLGEQAESTRREFLEARAEIPEPQIPAPSGLDAKGELRVSALYPPGSIPRRYRLVDASGPTDRTVAYLEIPAELPINVDDLLGRYVGVRAAEKRWQQGGVDPLPVYVVKELVPLSAPDQTQPVERADASAPQP